MFTIHKHVLTPDTVQPLKFKGYRILSAIEQFNEIVLYVALEKEYDTEFEYEILVLGTGHETEFDIEDDQEWHFLNTVKMEGGNLMFHVFYRSVSLWNLKN